MGERDHEFREWLRHTIGRLNRHETTVLEDSLARPRYDDPDVERRIVNLINRIAEAPNSQAGGSHRLTQRGANARRRH